MSTSNENGNTKSTTGARTRKKATSPASAEDKKNEDTVEKGGLVKAPKKSEIMELPDHARVYVSNSLPNHRPIELSNIDVVDSMSSSGIRPVMSGAFEVANTDSLPGHRPVAVSTLDISDLDTLPGHRPIASNEIDEEPGTLMGYLD
ncbi:MAG: hypothetical protein WBA76_00720 [Phormidesmis sp.]